MHATCIGRRCHADASQVRVLAAFLKPTAATVPTRNIAPSGSSSARRGDSDEAQGAGIEHDAVDRRDRGFDRVVVGLAYYFLVLAPR